MLKNFKKKFQIGIRIIGINRSGVASGFNYCYRELEFLAQDNSLLQCQTHSEYAHYYREIMKILLHLFSVLKKDRILRKSVNKNELFCERKLQFFFVPTCCIFCWPLVLYALEPERLSKMPGYFSMACWIPFKNTLSATWSVWGILFHENRFQAADKFVISSMSVNLCATKWSSSNHVRNHFHLYVVSYSVYHFCVKNGTSRFKIRDALHWV